MQFFLSPLGRRSGPKRNRHRQITIRNNVIHDSRDNDLLKINYGASEVTVEGNLFYNQSGSDEHIDINSARGVVVQDNVFFTAGL